MAEPSNWTRAVSQLPLCPFCGNDAEDLIDRRGAEWFCAVCSRQWLAYNVNDRRFLKSLRITPES